MPWELELRLALVAHPMDLVVPPTQTSIGLCAWELAHALAQQHEVFLIAPSDGRSRREFVSAGVNVILLPRRRVDRAFREALYMRSRFATHRLLPPARAASTSHFLHPAYAQLVRRELRRLQPSVIHIQHCSQYARGFRRTVPNAAIVLQTHAHWLDPLPRRVLKHRLAAVDIVATVSEWLRGTVLEKFPELGDRVVPIYNGTVRPAEIARPTKESDENILFVGAVTPGKGVHDLVDAFVSLAMRHPHARLQLVGSVGAWAVEETFSPGDTDQLPAIRHYFRGDYGAMLLERIPVELRDRVEFAGHLTAAEVLVRLHSAAMFVFPSASEEGFGLPPVEAMAAGIPVVVTRSGALPEITIDGVTGLVVDKGRPEQLEAAIERLLDDPELGRRLGEAGYRRAADFSWDRIAERADAAYELAIVHRDRRRHHEPQALFDAQEHVSISLDLRDLRAHADESAAERL